LSSCRTTTRSRLASCEWTHVQTVFMRVKADPKGLSRSHKHLAMMLEAHFARPERIWFNGLGSNAAVVDYLEGRGLDFSR
jgi:hypothetical protein